jgi:rod shape-determining protein MreD
MLSFTAFLLSLAALLCTSVLSHLLSLNAFIPQIPLIAFTYASLRRPFTEAAALALALSFLADLLSSGPPGLIQLILSFTFLLLFLSSRRLNGHLLILGPILSFLSSLLHDLTLATALTLRYPHLSPFSTMAQSMLWNALATATAFLPFGLLMAWIERLWLQRSDRHSLWR